MSGTALTGQRIELNGSSSSDEDGDTLSYEWSISSFPNSSSSSIDNYNSMNTFFIPDMAGSYIINLTVNDAENSTKLTSNVTVSDSKFTKFNSNGNYVSIESENYNCVLDIDTNLMWERKINEAGTHSKDNKYAWGDDSLITITNANGLCGYSDWRRPTANELVEMLNTVDDVQMFFFQFIIESGSTSVFWSSQYTGVDLGAGAILSSNSTWGIMQALKTEKIRVMLVRNN